MEMNALMSPHIMRFTRIDEEVGLGTCLDALGKERQTVLRHYGFIVIACDDLQLTLQVLGFAQQTGLLVTLRVRLGRVHIAFSVHHLVPVPVDDRTACYAYLEYLVIREMVMNPPKLQP